MPTSSLGGRPDEDHADDFAASADDLTYVTPFSHRVLPTVPWSRRTTRRARARRRRRSGPAARAHKLAAGRRVRHGRRRRAPRGQAAQRRLFAEVARLCDERGYAGLNVDFERLRPRTAAASASSSPGSEHERARAAARDLRRAQAAPGQGGIWHGAHDYRVHGELADRVVIMAYEWGRKAGPPAPVAPLGEVRKVLRHALGDPAVEAVARHSALWLRLGAARPARPRPPARPGRGARARHARGATSSTMPARAPVPVHGPSGREHLVWFEDDRSLGAKLDLVRARVCRRVALAASRPGRHGAPGRSRALCGREAGDVAAVSAA